MMWNTYIIWLKIAFSYGRGSYGTSGFTLFSRCCPTTKAARELLVSQPTLSKQLADLESELSVKLFIRGHRQITLTDEGEYLQARAKEIIQLADQTATNIQKEQVVTGTLSIGAGESIGMQRIMEVLAEF